MRKDGSAMIISVDETTDFLGSIDQMSADNPFACRIISMYKSYKPGLAFVDYWLIMDHSLRYTGAIARNGSVFVLYLTDLSDLDEVSAFMRVSGASGIICDGKYPLDFFGKKPKTGVIMSLSEATDDPCGNYVIEEPGIREAYYLIVRCADRNFKPPCFEDFYVDVNHRLRHKTMRMYGVRENKRLVAVAMTVAESREGAVLGAVACDPEYRKSGYGSAVVKYISNRIIADGKTVYIHRAENANERFYDRLGFTGYGSWSEYYN